MSLAAALALYPVIALAPLVTVMLMIAGMIFGDRAAEWFVREHANRLVVEARDADDPEAEAKIAHRSAKDRMSGKA
ncbi:MAG: hypothetical protein H0V56_09370 [Chthoniobacterales bacterium]|nr:hypothetical protein [Chthoniobacterales bacterium]